MWAEVIKNNDTSKREGDEVKTRCWKNIWIKMKSRE